MTASAQTPSPSPRGATRRADEGDQRLEEVVRRFENAYANNDVEGALALFAEDGLWAISPGVFKGKERIQQVLDWTARLNTEAANVRPAGIGVLVKENIAISETRNEESAEGIRYAYPCVSVFEFNADGKIQRLRTYYEKLTLVQSVANQLPGIKGWLAKKLINSVVAQGEKGLDRTGALSWEEALTDSSA